MLASVELRELDASSGSVFTGGTYAVGNRRALACRLRTRNGETSDVVLGNEADYQAVKQHVRQMFDDHLLGRDPACVRGLWSGMASRIKGSEDIRTRVRALAVLDTALWVLNARLRRQPLWKLIGGHRPSAPVIGIGGYYESCRDRQGIAEEIALFRAQELAGIKFKIGALTPDEDAERFIWAREAAGEDFHLIADANMAWDLDDTLQFCRRVAGHRPAWLEEPIDWRNTNHLLGLVNVRAGIPICSGQSEATIYDCWPLIRDNAVDVINVTYNRGGGITGWLKLAEAASFAGIRMAQVAEPQISLHLMCGIANGTFVEIYPHKDRDPIWHGLYRDKPTISDGKIMAPEESVLGVSIDYDVLEKYAVEAWG